MMYWPRFFWWMVKGWFIPSVRGKGSSMYMRRVEVLQKNKTVLGTVVAVPPRKNTVILLDSGELKYGGVFRPFESSTFKSN